MSECFAAVGVVYAETRTAFYKTSFFVIIKKMCENQNIEWKESWRDEYLKWICGFANASGGRLCIGIDDAGKAVPIKNIGKLLEDLPNKIRESLGIVVDVNVASLGGKDYIEIDVPAYQVPISCKGTYYFRSGSTNQRLTGLELENFIMRKRGATWDNIPLPCLRLEDIDKKAVQKFRELALRSGRMSASVRNEPVETLLEKLHLKNGKYFTNAAMLLFTEDPERWQLGAYTKIGMFESDADLLYQDEIHGSLFEQVEKIMEVLHLKYMKATVSYKGLQRIERFPLPDDALREAVLNAICHKDYSSGIPIQISVYKDKLYVANCGILPENLSVEKLMGKHASEPFNPNIAHVFYLSGLVESWGRGVEKMCEECKSFSLPSPTYTMHRNDIMIKFSLVTDVTEMDDNVTDFVTENSGDVTNDTENVIENDNFVTDNDTNVTKNGDDVTDSVTENSDDVTKNRDSRIEKILQEISHKSYISTTELAEKLNVSKRTILRDIEYLKLQNILLRHGSGRGSLWEIVKK